ncbi:MAG: hypothetical protein ACREOZ_04465 [Gloeomargaritales cyanobacterium]
MNLLLPLNVVLTYLSKAPFLYDLHRQYEPKTILQSGMRLNLSMPATFTSIYGTPDPSSTTHLTGDNENEEVILTETADANMADTFFPSTSEGGNKVHTQWDYEVTSSQSKVDSAITRDDDDDAIYVELEREYGSDKTLQVHHNVLTKSNITAMTAREVNTIREEVFTTVHQELVDSISGAGDDPSLYTPEPSTVSQVLKLKGVAKERWLAATKSEFKSVIANKTFDLKGVINADEKVIH